MALRLRRGTNQDRLSMIPEEGELIYVTDWELDTLAGTPRDGSGVSVGHSVSPLWVGDGATTGGNAAGATTLDELADVQLGGIDGVALDQGQVLVYDETAALWRNTRDITAQSSSQVVGAVRSENFNSDATNILRTALRVVKKNTGGTTGVGKGGPAILFESKGTTSANDASIIQVGALNQSGGDHDFVVYASADNFTTSEELFKSSRVRTTFHNGLLYIDDDLNRVGILDNTPSYELDVNGTTRSVDGVIANLVKIGTASSPNITLDGSNNLVLDSTGGTTQINDFVQITQNMSALGATLGNVQVGVTTDQTIDTASGSLTINCASGSVTITPNTVISGDLAVNGGDITTSQSSATIFGTTATAIQLGGSTSTITIPGDLVINGTTTTINSTTLSVDDKNIELGSVSIPTDTTANGGGITLKGTTDKTITWSSGNDKWNLSHGLYIAGDFVTGAGHSMFFNGGSFTNGQPYGIIHDASTANTILGNDLALAGSTIRLNYGAASGVDSYIYVERGTTDAFIKWDQLGSYWRTSNEFRTDGKIYAQDDGFLGGDRLVLNNGAASDITARLEVNRPVANNSTYWQWNETNKYWEPQNAASDTTLNNVFVGGDVTANGTVYTGAVSIDSRAGLDTSNISLATGATSTITYTSRNVMKAVIYITDTTTNAVHSLEALVMRNGASAMITTYGEMYSASALATFTADVSSGDLRLRATSASANTLSISVVRTSLT